MRALGRPDARETWSLPWHDLQRSLAAMVHASGAGLHGRRVLSKGSSARVRTEGMAHVAMPAGSWLRRARALAEGAGAK